MTSRPVLICCDMNILPPLFLPLDNWNFATGKDRSRLWNFGTQYFRTDIQTWRGADGRITRYYQIDSNLRSRALLFVVSNIEHNSNKRLTIQTRISFVHCSATAFRPVRSLHFHLCELTKPGSERWTVASRALREAAQRCLGQIKTQRMTSANCKTDYVHTVLLESVAKCVESRTHHRSTW